jgi:hypothetical protein
MKNAGLKCDICGATESLSGKPFTPAGLGAHKAHLHSGKETAAQTAEEPPAGALICDICGVDHNARGVTFRTDADVAQHKRRIHGVSTNKESGKESQKESKKAAASASKSERVRKAPSLEANHVKFCPRCGFNMEIVNAAMALVNGN